MRGGGKIREPSLFHLLSAPARQKSRPSTRAERIDRSQRFSLRGRTLPRRRQKSLARKICVLGMVDPRHIVSPGTRLFRSSQEARNPDELPVIVCIREELSSTGARREGTLEDALRRFAGAGGERDGNSRNGNEANQTGTDRAGAPNEERRRSDGAKGSEFAEQGGKASTRSRVSARAHAGR